jgi:hypothetical protein
MGQNCSSNAEDDDLMFDTELPMALSEPIGILCCSINQTGPPEPLSVKGGHGACIKHLVFDPCLEPARHCSDTCSGHFDQSKWAH